MPSLCWRVMKKMKPSSGTCCSAWRGWGESPQQTLSARKNTFFVSVLIPAQDCGNMSLLVFTTKGGDEQKWIKHTSEGWEERNNVKRSVFLSSRCTECFKCCCGVQVCDRFSINRTNLSSALLSRLWPLRQEWGMIEKPGELLNGENSFENTSPTLLLGSSASSSLPQVFCNLEILKNAPDLVSLVWCHHGSEI